MSRTTSPLSGNLGKKSICLRAEAATIASAHTYVSRYETGERMLGVDEYVAVALAIGVDPVALLGDVLQSRQDEPTSDTATEDVSSPPAAS